MSRWSEARNLLCVRLDDADDVLATTPAIRALRNSVSGRRITLLASRAGARAARLVPEIDEVIEFEAPWIRSTEEGRTSDGTTLARIEELGARIVLAGEPLERPLIEGIRAEMTTPSVSVAGRLGLAELGALIARANVLVSGSGSPTRIAGALGTPVVDLHELTQPHPLSPASAGGATTSRS